MIPIDLMAECNRRFADQISSASQTWKHFIEHNIGQGPHIEDVLFNWKITGHYRYYGP